MVVSIPRTLSVPCRPKRNLPKTYGNARYCSGNIYIHIYKVLQYMYIILVSTLVCPYRLNKRNMEATFARKTTRGI